MTNVFANFNFGLRVFLVSLLQLDQGKSLIDVVVELPRLTRHAECVPPAASLKPCSLPSRNFH